MKNHNDKPHQQGSSYTDPDYQDNPDEDVASYNMADLDFLDFDEELETDSDRKDAGNHKDSHGERRFPFSLVLHVLFFLVIIGGIAAIIFKFSNWGTYVDLHQLAQLEVEDEKETFDEIFPVLANPEDMPADDGIQTILAFGNAPLADDRDSEKGLANILASEPNTIFYNCSVSGSCLSSSSQAFDADLQPMDAYSFYWLVTLAVTGANKDYYPTAVEALGIKAPPEAQEVYDTLTTIDLNTVDTILIMYDGTDYFMGRSMYNDDNSTDITCFTGNMEAGIEMIQNHYPHIRIIVMSPAYVYAVDLEGNYVSSDMYTYGQHVFSTYVIKQYSSAFSRSVTFVDNLYGTITADNAKKYLTDNIHLNQKGRKLMAERFLYALHYYDEMEQD